MNITDLIKELQKIHKEHGNIEVAVQYRDEGGDYHGVDEDIRLDVDDVMHLGFHDNEDEVRKTLIL